MTSIQQTHTSHGSEGEKEFSFWCSSSTISSTNDCNEAEFGETSTISCPSRSKLIAERRRELMEMMQDMPESSYELSFQDMVIVEEQVVEPEPEPEPEPNRNETSLENSHMQNSSNKSQFKGKIKKKKSKSNSRAGQIMRVESMDTETFLLKMFFPSSLDWMKKTKMKNGSSKVSPRPSLQESLRQVGKEWRIKKFFIAANNRGHAEEEISQNNPGQSNRDKNRYVDHSFSFSHGCWPFVPYTKSKSKKLEE